MLGYAARQVHSGGIVVALDDNRQPGHKDTLPGGVAELAHEKAMAIDIMNATESERS